MRDMRAWLERIGLGQHAEVFAANDVDWAVLPDLTETDLERLGLSLGHRRRLLKALASLNEMTAETPDGSAPGLNSVQPSTVRTTRAAERRQRRCLNASTLRTSVR